MAHNHMQNGLHASDGGMYMDKEDTMGTMKDGVSTAFSRS